MSQFTSGPQPTGTRRRQAPDVSPLAEPRIQPQPIAPVAPAASNDLPQIAQALQAAFGAGATALDVLNRQKNEADAERRRKAAELEREYAKADAEAEERLYTEAHRLSAEGTDEQKAEMLEQLQGTRFELAARAIRTLTTSRAMDRMAVEREAEATAERAERSMNFRMAKQLTERGIEALRDEVAANPDRPVFDLVVGWLGDDEMPAEVYDRTLGAMVAELTSERNQARDLMQRRANVEVRTSARDAWADAARSGAENAGQLFKDYMDQADATGLSPSRRVSELRDAISSIDVRTVRDLEQALGMADFIREISVEDAEAVKARAVASFRRNEVDRLESKALLAQQKNDPGSYIEAYNEAIRRVALDPSEPEYLPADDVGELISMGTQRVKAMQATDAAVQQKIETGEGTLTSQHDAAITKLFDAAGVTVAGQVPLNDQEQALEWLRLIDRVERVPTQYVAQLDAAIKQDQVGPDTLLAADMMHNLSRLLSPAAYAEMSTGLDPVTKNRVSAYLATAVESDKMASPGETQVEAVERRLKGARAAVASITPDSLSDAKQVMARVPEAERFDLVNNAISDHLTSSEFATQEWQRLIGLGNEGSYTPALGLAYVKAAQPVFARNLQLFAAPGEVATGEFDDKTLARAAAATTREMHLEFVPVPQNNVVTMQRRNGVPLDAPMMNNYSEADIFDEARKVRPDLDPSEWRIITVPDQPGYVLQHAAGGGYLTDDSGLFVYQPLPWKTTQADIAKMEANIRENTVSESAKKLNQRADAILWISTRRRMMEEGSVINDVANRLVKVADVEITPGMEAWALNTKAALAGVEAGKASTLGFAWYAMRGIQTTIGHKVLGTGASGRSRAERRSPSIMGHIFGVLEGIEFNTPGVPAIQRDKGVDPEEPKGKILKRLDELF